MIKPVRLLPDLTRRAEDAECMDRPDSDLQRLENTLALFENLNRCMTQVRHILNRYVIRAMQRDPEREYHLVELGAGACETAAWLLGYCREKKLKLRVSACDHDHRVVQYARKNYGSTPRLKILHRDIKEIDDLFPIDFIFANHLLHHLSDLKIIDLIQYMSKFSRATVVFNDIKRSRLSYTAYYLLSYLFPPKSFARYDGLVSVRKGFTTTEIRGYITKAQTQGLKYQIKTLFPGRILLIGRPLLS